MTNDCRPTDSRLIPGNLSRLPPAPLKGAAVSQSVGGCREAPKLGGSGVLSGNRPAPASRPTLQSKMADQDEPVTVKPKRMPPSRKGKGPTPSSWKPGQSGNPKGRPRAGLAFAERVRERVDPDLVIELAMRVACDESLSPQERLIALWPLIDRGYVRPPAGLDLNVARDQDEPSLAHLSEARLRELLAEIDGEPVLTDGSGNRTLPTTIDIGTPEAGH